MDGDACTECGRCQDACPAYAAGQPLSPKALVMDLRDRMSHYPGKLWKWQEPIVERLSFLRPLALGSGEPQAVDLVAEEQGGGVIWDETLWSCTTCRACGFDRRPCRPMILASSVRWRGSGNGCSASDWTACCRGRRGCDGLRDPSVRERC